MWFQSLDAHLCLWQMEFHFCKPCMIAFWNLISNMNMKSRWRYGFQVLPWVLQLVPFQQMQVLEIQSCMHLCIVGMHACCSTFVFHVAVFFPFQACQQTNGAGMGRIRQGLLDDCFELFVLGFFLVCETYNGEPWGGHLQSSHGSSHPDTPCDGLRNATDGNNEFIHVGVSEKNLIRHPHQNAGWPIELGSGARTTWGMDLNFYHRC